MTLSFVIPEINIGGAGTPPLQFYRRGFVLNGTGGSQPSWKDIILHGVTALTLVNAKEDGLNYLKLFGGTELLSETYIDSVTLEGKCEQSGTPTPTVPVDVVCNNGAIKYGYTSKNLNVGELDNKGYTSTGGTSTSTTFCGTLWKIKVSEGEKYTVSYGNFSDGISGVFVNTWKTDGTWNLRQAISISSAYTYTIPAGIGEVNFTLYKTGGITIDSNSWIQVEKGETATDYVPAGYGLHTEGTTETVTDSNQLTATAEMLLSVGDYKDTQEVLTGAVTRNVGIKVFDGTENFSTSNATFTYAVSDRVTAKTPLLCSHFEYSTKTSSQVEDLKIISFSSTNIGFRYDACADTTAFKAWLAEQYNAGSPVIVVYPTSSSTTETVTPQILQKEPVTVTGSLTGLVANVVSSSHTTPTPTQPLPINTNNGVLKVSPNLFDVSQTIVSTRTDVVSALLTSPSVYNKANCTNATVGSLIPMGNSTASVALKFNLGDSYTVISFEALGTLARRSWATTDEDGYVVERGAYSDGGTITPTLSAKYIYIQFGATLSSTQIGGCEVVKGNVAPENYMPYGQVYIQGTKETVEVVGKNLIDMTKLTPHKYINLSGVITAGGYGYSDFIPVVAGAKYTYNATYTDTATSTRIHGYKDGVWQQQIFGNAAAFYPKTITIPAGINQVRISFYPQPTNPQFEVGESATTYEPYYSGGSATAEMLLKVGDYQDEQSVLDGEVTRKVGIKVLDGTEVWVMRTLSGKRRYQILLSPLAVAPFYNALNTHGVFLNATTNGAWSIRGDSYLCFYDDGTLYTDVTAFRNWLADQYANGTPVIVVYPLATATTETVTAQTLNNQAGTNIVEITQASIDGLPLEVSYKAGVEVTVTEIENAQLSNSVTVTVS